MVTHIGGAINDVPPEATAVSGRDAQYWFLWYVNLGKRQMKAELDKGIDFSKSLKAALLLARLHRDRVDGLLLSHTCRAREIGVGVKEL